MKSATYTRIIESREKAMSFEIDGNPVWLPKKGLTINPAEQLVAHNLLEKAISDSKDRGVTVDLGDSVWSNDEATSFGYDTKLYFEGFDDDLASEVRVFVPAEVNDPGAIPLRFVKEAIERTVPGDLTTIEWELRNADDTVVYDSKVANADSDREATEADEAAANGSEQDSLAF